MSAPWMSDPKFCEAHAEFQRLWTRCVGGPLYDKRAWMALDRRLMAGNTDDVLRRARKLADHQTGQVAS